MLSKSGPLVKNRLKSQYESPNAICRGDPFSVRFLASSFVIEIDVNNEALTSRQEFEKDLWVSPKLPISSLFLLLRPLPHFGLNWRSWVL